MLNVRCFHLILLILPALFAANLRAAGPPWQRVVVIGASASAGFVFSEPFGGRETTRCKLNYYLDAAIAAPHPPVKNLASPLLFMNPEALAPLQIEAATKASPTLVIGVDFLFWFCYGDADDDAARARRFEHGLKLLDQIHCPLVVGDIPDAACATNTGIIGGRQVPSAAARRAANQRLKQWAAAHPQVVVVPLANFMRAMMANADFKLHGETLPAGKTRALLQADELHPNPHGAAVLALCILDKLVSRQPEFPAADVRWNPADVFRIGCKSAALADNPRQAGE
jgi:hypothetical protein